MFKLNPDNPTTTMGSNCPSPNQQIKENILKASAPMGHSDRVWKLKDLLVQQAPADQDLTRVNVEILNPPGLGAEEVGGDLSLEAAVAVAGAVAEVIAGAARAMAPHSLDEIMTGDLIDLRKLAGLKLSDSNTLELLREGTSQGKRLVQYDLINLPCLFIDLDLRMGILMLCFSHDQPLLDLLSAIPTLDLELLQIPEGEMRSRLYDEYEARYCGNLATLHFFKFPDEMEYLSKADKFADTCNHAQKENASL